jgi:uncharacterized protein
MGSSMRLKPSQYNLITHSGSRSYIFNTNSLNSISLDRVVFLNVLEILREIAETGCIARSNPLLEKVLRILKKHRFIIDYNVDEMAEIRQSYTCACTDDTLRLTIIPTISCNMCCHYCYEGTAKNIPGWKLREEQWGRVIEFADQRLQKGGNIIVHWFGGEPLLQKKSIYRLSENLMALAEKKEASYAAWITTNGYNLDALTAAKLKDCKVKKVQITFDGSKPYHDQVRFIVNKSIHSGSYDRLINNILASSDILRFVLRFHVTPSNLDSFQQLVEDLAAKGLPSKVAYAAVHLIESVNPQDRHKSHQSKPETFSTREFASLETGLLRKLHEHGFKLKSPFAHASGCMVDHKNHYLIDADGSLKQCDHYVGDPGSGYSNLYNQNIINNIDNLTRWNVDRFNNSDCLECSFFPVCLQGCLNRLIESDKKEKACPTIRYNWQDILPFFYEIESHY